MTRDEIYKNVHIALGKTFPEADLSSISLSTHLRDDLNADSMDSISLLMELEDQFGATLPPEQATELMVIGQIIEFIEAQLYQEESQVVTQ